MKPYSIDRTSAYKREYRKMAKRGYDMAELDYVVTLLATRASLPPKYKDHALAGNWKGFRECHIAPDWLLIYKIEANVLILTLQRTGSHSDLF
ncbi:MAG: type II toxin-antitoxin system YafQ family toxin [Defluviitaleaceae bacterium]|nr:type II toxin-antitoxin system YafQ family toxin [Defluviitaleaceae bacterium]